MGEGLKSLRKDFVKKITTLAEKNQTLDIICDTRKELIRMIYKALGYYNFNHFAYNKEIELTVKSRKIKLPLERKIDFNGDGELFLLAHFPEKGMSQLEEIQKSCVEMKESDAEINSEFMFNEPIPTTYKDRSSSEALKDIIDSIFDGDQTNCEYLIINSGDKLYLLERGKWQESQCYLELNLRELYDEINEIKYYKMAEGLFSPRPFPIKTAENFHEDIERNAHKKASEVTQALRNTVKESVEMLANEVLKYHKNNPLPAWKNRSFEDYKDRSQCAKELFDQTLMYVYKMLFIFFTESQDKSKGMRAIHSKIYQNGYSLEKLRNLESKVYLSSESEGSKSQFIQQTLEQTFMIYYKGYNQQSQQGDCNSLGFTFPSLGTKLFNPESTPLYDNVPLRDEVFQKVICKMSLAKTSQKNRPQRVHYAGLGLNQLGAVYEGLLSFKPEILSEKAVLLVSKNKGKECVHQFIPFRLSNFKSGNRAKDAEGQPLIKEKGSFVLTTLGLERKLSASFYTPEVLTRFVAKEVVDQLLGDSPNLEFMENLKILEPAMGSGAFANAVVDEIAPRMAKLYENASKSRYEEEQKGSHLEESKLKPSHFYLSKAKHHLIKYAVHGVDLNETAVELAKISSWLNSLHSQSHLPFLGLKMRLGNSLVGAWVNRYKDNKTDLPHWFFPNPQAFNPILKGVILGDKKRPFVKGVAKAKLTEVKEDWKKWKEDKKDMTLLQELSQRVRELYQNHLTLKMEYQEKIQRTKKPTEKEELFNEYITHNTSYNQLRLMMDYWCSLWFWPHNKVDKLPKGPNFIEALRWLSNHPLPFGEEQEKKIKTSGIPSLIISRKVALQNKFFHYDLEFAEVFKNGGFDLCLGNPPWASIRWVEQDFFELHFPKTRGLPGDSNKKNSIYKNILNERPEIITEYIHEKLKIQSLSHFLKNSQTYRFEDHSPPNTYKYFYQRFYETAKQKGLYAMISQDGILNDQGCRKIRPTYLKELTHIFRFWNKAKLFKDVHNEKSYMIGFFQKDKKNLEFELMDNLFHPDTVEKSRNERCEAPYRGKKSEDGSLELRGHPQRIVTIDEKSLKSLSFSPSSDVSIENTCLPIIHGQAEFDLLLKMSTHKKKIKLGQQTQWTTCFHEDGAPKKEYISKQPGQSKHLKEVVITGPNIFVAHPAFKQPNPGCKNNTDFSKVNLEELEECGDDFFPETVYQAHPKVLNLTNTN